MVITMKKTISLLLAIVVAAIAICTLSVCAFADPADGETATTTEAAKETTTAIDLGDPRETTAASTTAAPTTNKADDTTATTKTGDTTATTKTGDDVVTNPSGVTSIDDGDETTKKAPAKVDDEIPNTGSGVVVPAVALLALAGGVAVAVKSKKD